MKALEPEEGVEDQDEDYGRARLFIETIGFNGWLGFVYIGCKILTVIIIACIFVFLRGFIGDLYTPYGYDVLLFWLNGSKTWPTPMDVVFPKMAKCEWNIHDVSGDISTIAAQCQLPMNNITRWSFFFLWWYLVVIFVVSLLHVLFCLLILSCPCHRNGRYRSIVYNICSAEVGEARRYEVRSRSGKLKMKMHSLRKVIKVNVSFGDWFLLHFMEQNLSGIQFRGFIARLAVLENKVMYIKSCGELARKHAEANATAPALETSVAIDGNPEEIPPPPAYNSTVGCAFENELLNMTPPPNTAGPSNQGNKPKPLVPPKPGNSTNANRGSPSSTPGKPPAPPVPPKPTANQSASSTATIETAAPEKPKPPTVPPKPGTSDPTRTAVTFRSRPKLKPSLPPQKMSTTASFTSSTVLVTTDANNHIEEQEW